MENYVGPILTQKNLNSPKEQPKTNAIPNEQPLDSNQNNETEQNCDPYIQAYLVQSARGHQGVFNIRDSYNMPYGLPVNSDINEVEDDKDIELELSPNSRKKVIEKYRQKRSKRVRFEGSVDSVDMFSRHDNDKMADRKPFLTIPFAERLKRRIVKSKSSLKRFGKRVELIINSEAYGNILTAVNKEPKIYYS